MIQRLQSLFLLLTILLSVLFPVGVIMTFSDGMNEISLRFNEITGGEMEKYNLEQLIPLDILIVIIPLLSGFIIFKYKNRKLQIRLTMLLIVLIVAEMVAIGYMIYYITETYNAELKPGIKLLIPVLLLILSILSYRYIKKDEELVRSYDRLR